MIRVVVAEDDQPFRELLVRAINDHPHMRVVAAAYDGPTAINYVRSFSPDALVTDVYMPGMSGLHVVERLRSERPGLVIIVLTGSVTAATRDHARRIGADVVMTKDGFIDGLLAQLESTIPHGEVYDDGH